MDGVEAATPSSYRHGYATRSSPAPSPSVSPVIDPTLFRLRADIHVKDTVCGRDSKGKRLPQQVFEGANWPSLKNSIFQHCLPHIQRKATPDGEPRVWVVNTETTTVEDFDSFVSIKMGRYFFKPASTAQAHRYIVEHQSSTFVIAIFKWGNQVNTASDYQQFQDQCIRPQEQDRAGAAAESMHNAMVQTLKEKWGSTYTSYESNWRMWASSILKTPSHQHESHVSNPPPLQMLHLFVPVPNIAQVRNENIQQSMAVALDVVDTCLEDFCSLKRFMVDVVSRIESDIIALRAKRRTIQGFLQEITPIAQQDEEHNEVEE
ncbi:hypothetical protein AC1031_011791 [Aphanomyces cochlioides]|nr:hypothetical protein AC1031_011791 [Aphanomyces cochlioides]